jgi:drug/metabolite transporter (DMT)-like permease
MESHTQLRGIAALLLAGFVFVINDTLMQLALASLPPFEVLVLRGIAGIAFGFALLAWRGEVRWHPALLSWPVMLRALLECGAILTYIIALAHASIGDVTALFQTTPLLVMLGLVLFQGEKASWIRIGFVLLGFGGALLVAQPGQGTVSPYVMLALLTACFAAARDLAARRIAADVPALLSTLVLMAAVLVVAGISSALFEKWVAPTPAVLALPFVAGLGMMLGHHFTLLAYRLAKAQAIAPFYYSFLVFAVIAGYFVFGKLPNPLGFVGMAVIVLSGLAILALEKRERADVFQSSDL